MTGVKSFSFDTSGWEAQARIFQRWAMLELAARIYGGGWDWSFEKEML